MAIALHKKRVCQLDDRRVVSISQCRQPRAGVAPSYMRDRQCLHLLRIRHRRQQLLPLARTCRLSSGGRISYSCPVGSLTCPAGSLVTQRIGARPRRGAGPQWQQQCQHPRGFRRSCSRHCCWSRRLPGCRRGKGGALGALAPSDDAVHATAAALLADVNVVASLAASRAPGAPPFAGHAVVPAACVSSRCFTTPLFRFSEIHLGF